jgi:predicted DNA-binding helix-hairpin-helix protein
MNFDRLKEKLEILADAAKYDVSCSSSGGTRKNKKGALGDSSVSGSVIPIRKTGDVSRFSKFF